jgi:hypothetical protein
LAERAGLRIHEVPVDWIDDPDSRVKVVSTEHNIHYFVGQNQASFGGGTGDAAQITAWVQKHVTSQTIAGITVYNLTSPVSD